MEPLQRAKFLMGVFELELSCVKSVDRDSLEYAIQNQIQDALKDQKAEFNKTVINKARAVEANERRLNPKKIKH